MKVFIAYSSKSCVTGKALKLALNGKRKKTNRRARCDLFIRWGSTEQFNNTNSVKELNSLESVNRTVNKLSMLQCLKGSGIPTPDFNTDLSLIDNFKDDTGNLYIRSKLGVVRYASDYCPIRDSYYSKPIPLKRREYRVHVFNGKVIGIYEKVPLSEGRPALFKSDTCRFVRCDPNISRVDQNAQQICIQAVNALGLLCGGVDLIRDKNKNVFVCEVNSAPGLNSSNIQRWVDEIQSYYAIQ
jgi:glutathione synthase/RimK-type ligase-like ATP-grasp enzyme